MAKITITGKNVNKSDTLYKNDYNKLKNDFNNLATINKETVDFSQYTTSDVTKVNLAELQDACRKLEISFNGNCCQANCNQNDQENCTNQSETAKSCQSNQVNQGTACQSNQQSPNCNCDCCGYCGNMCGH